MGWSANRPTGLTFHRAGLSTKGYTLVTPSSDNVAYLIDMDGQVVHRWQFDSINPGYGRLLKNGNLLMSGSDPALPDPPEDEPTKPRRRLNVTSPGLVVTRQRCKKSTGTATSCGSLRTGRSTTTL